MAAKMVAGCQLALVDTLSSLSPDCFQIPCTNYFTRSHGQIHIGFVQSTLLIHPPKWSSPVGGHIINPHWHYCTSSLLDIMLDPMSESDSS